MSLGTERATAIRPARAAAPAQHGAFDYQELETLGLRADDLVDFSVNSNPYGPSPAVRQALNSVPLERYPDRECLALRRQIGQAQGVPIERLVVGNGTAELLMLIAQAFIRPPTATRDRVLILGPTFGEYRRVCELMGAEVHECRAPETGDFRPDEAAIERALRRTQPRIAFLCHPNNPTGATYADGAIASWCAGFPETLFVVDEAYLAFAPACASALACQAPNLLVLRSMTKDYALAGLRLGYAVGPASLVDAVAQMRPAWNVSALAQAAGVAALQDRGHLVQSMAALREATISFVGDLNELGLRPVPSAVHYFIVAVGDGTAFRRALLVRGVVVRDCASFGLPGYVRIATRTPSENARLLRAVSEVQACRD